MKLYKITCHITSNVARMKKPIKDLMRFYVIAGSKSDAKARAQTECPDWNFYYDSRSASVEEMPNGIYHEPINQWRPGELFQW